MNRFESPIPSRCVVLVQSAIGDYRDEFLAELSRLLDGRLLVAAGDTHFEPTVVVIRPESCGAVLKNHYLLGRRLLWQRHALSVGVRAEIAILEFNPRILSAWATAIVRRCLRRPTVFWGHAFPRRGPAGLGMLLRGGMARLSRALIVYTETDARKVTAYGWRTHVVAAPNAVYSSHTMAPLRCADARGFIYVGRLVEPKKPRLMIEALAIAAHTLGSDAYLRIVGDGPLLPELEALGREHQISDRVEFLGHVNDVERLRILYSQALASISPGYVGLALTQSLGFGVPMVIARDEPHAPEIEAARDGVNAAFFASDDVEDLANALINIASHRGSWLSRRDEIARAARDCYSTEAMARSFSSAVNEI